MSKKTPLILHLKWIKGSSVAVSREGVLQNENGIVKLQFDTMEYYNYLKFLVPSGYCEVTIEKAVSVKGVNDVEEVEIPEEAIEHVKKAMEGSKPVLTDEQKRIADLEAKIETLMEGKNPIKKEVTETKVKEDSSDLEAARDEYFKALGKKPSHLMKIENLKKAVQEAK